MDAAAISGFQAVADHDRLIEDILAGEVEPIQVIRIRSAAADPPLPGFLWLAKVLRAPRMRSCIM